MTGFFVMENQKKIQPNYEELKKQSELTDKFIKLANKLKIDDKDVPKTDKGRATKTKELIEKLNKKIEKITEEETDVFQLKKKRLKKDWKKHNEENED
jgi:ribosome-binding protein aMBF1 (putative translation factor)